MSKFQRVHPVKLQPAVASAIVDRGLSAAAAVRLLEDAKLPGWNGAYRLPLKTAQHWAQLERARQREALLKRADPATVDVELAAALNRCVLELDRRARAIDAKTSTEDIGRLARAIRETSASARAVGREAPGPGQDGARSNGSNGHDAKRDSAPALLDRLAKQTASEPAGGAT